MPDGKTWFAQNLNYTKDLTYNTYAHEANGKQFTSTDNGIPAIGSYWCPAVNGSVTSGSEADCRTYGALYTWETAMMVDGKYADETKTSTAWDESWVSPNYYVGAPNSSPNADKNNARGGTNVKGGGRGICPLGWHVPTAKEWAVLLDLVNEDGTGSYFSNTGCGAYYSTDVLAKLRSPMSYQNDEPGDGSWHPSTPSNADQTQFGLLPPGVRIAEITDALRDGFYWRGLNTHVWMSSVVDPHGSGNFNCDTGYGCFMQCLLRYNGASVRCVAD
jgi:uncharacterized protein (TIGR02145 family)